MSFTAFFETHTVKVTHCCLIIFSLIRLRLLRIVQELEQSQFSNLGKKYVIERLARHGTFKEAEFFFGNFMSGNFRLFELIIFFHF